MDWWNLAKISTGNHGFYHLLPLNRSKHIPGTWGYQPTKPWWQHPAYCFGTEIGTLNLPNWSSHKWMPSTEILGWPTKQPNNIRDLAVSGGFQQRKSDILLSQVSLIGTGWNGIDLSTSANHLTLEKSWVWPWHAMAVMAPPGVQNNFWLLIFFAKESLGELWFLSCPLQVLSCSVLSQSYELVHNPREP